MLFKIKNTEVKVSFTFFAVLLLFILIDKAQIYFLSLIASALHETVHIIFILLFGGTIKKLSFNFFGGEIERGVIRFSNIKEAVINISAPVLNIIIGSMLLIIYPDSLFGLLNLFLGIFNILPFHSFDGGRALSEFLLIKFTEKTAKAVLTSLSVFVTIVFSFFSVVIFFNYNKNFMLVSMSVFLILSIFSDLIKTKNCKDL